MCGYAAAVCRGIALWRSARPKRARREGEVSAVEAEGMLEIRVVVGVAAVWTGAKGAGPEVLGLILVTRSCFVAKRAQGGQTSFGSISSMRFHAPVRKRTAKAVASSAK